MDHAEHPLAGDEVYRGFRITSLWAWTVVDPADDQEGIAAFLGADGTWVPLIASDRVRLNDLQPLADRTAQALGRPVRLRRFVPAEEEGGS